MEAEWKSMLVDMGFSAEMAEKALRATNASGVEAAIEYIQKLQDQEEQDEKNPDDTMNVDALSTAPTPALTEAERKARDERIEQLRLKVTAERAEKERIEALEREKQRRGRGQEISAIREKFNEEETKRLVAERRKDKDIEQKERERLRALIEQDKLNRKLRQAAEAAGETSDTPLKSSSAAASASSAAGGDTAAAAKRPPTDHKETRIQIRQLNGERLVQTFQASEPLSAVRVYCELNRTDKSTAPFIFIQPHPRREYSDEDYQTPLKHLDLVPSGTLLMTKPRPIGNVESWM